MAEVLLTVDTASRSGSVALTRGEEVLGEFLLNLPATHSERLLRLVAQLLADVGLGLELVDAFAVVHGPGSFTGLRVGVATVKGLALATGKPAVGVSSLAALAMSVPFSRLPVCTLLDARKSEVYAGLYAWEHGMPRSLRPEAALPPESLLSSLDGEVLFIGDGAMAYRSLILHELGGRAHFAPGTHHPLRASAAAALALSRLRNGEALSPERLVPVYLRPSEAEILWSRRRAEGSIEG